MLEILSESYNARHSQVPRTKSITRRSSADLRENWNALVKLLILQLPDGDILPMDQLARFLVRHSPITWPPQAVNEKGDNRRRGHKDNNHTLFVHPTI
jgi:hypothetical protein